MSDQDEKREDELTRREEYISEQLRLLDQLDIQCEITEGKGENNSKYYTYSIVPVANLICAGHQMDLRKLKDDGFCTITPPSLLLSSPDGRPSEIESKKSSLLAGNTNTLNVEDAVPANVSNISWIENKEKSSRIKKFVCPVNGCKVSYDVKKLLREHHNVVHQGIRYECGICGSKFRSRSGRIKHETSAHKLHATKAVRRRGKNTLLSDKDNA